MTTDNPNQPMLDGLELGSRQSALRDAVITTIQALHDDKLLQPRHAGLAQLALELADAVAHGNSRGRASAAAMAAAQLRETLMALPAPADKDIMDRFDAFVDSLKDSA
jgi:hypothetical protein